MKTEQRAVKPHATNNMCTCHNKASPGDPFCVFLLFALLHNSRLFLTGEIRPQSMILPPPCLIVGKNVIFLRCCANFASKVSRLLVCWILFQKKKKKKILGCMEMFTSRCETGLCVLYGLELLFVVFKSWTLTRPGELCSVSDAPGWIINPPLKSRRQVNHFLDVPGSFLWMLSLTVVYWRTKRLEITFWPFPDR